MIKINLVPSDILARAQQKQRVFQVAVVGVLLLGLLVAASMGHWLRLNRMEAKLAKDEADLKKLEAIVSKVEELERTAAAVRARLGVVTDLLKGRTLYPTFMSDFAFSVPMGVRVKSLSTSGGGSSIGPLKLNLMAESRTNVDIAGWIRKMEETGKFSTVELGPVSAALSGGEKSYSFTVTATYSMAAAL